MSAPTATTVFAVPAPGTCYDTFTEAVAALNALVSTTIGGDYPSVVTGSSTPAVEDQDKIWDRRDAQGRPIGLYIYHSGHWVKIYTLPIGATVIFTGDPTGLFDGTGLGIIDTDWYGFAFCNGQNGTEDFTDRFPIGGVFSSGVWKSSVTGTAAETGGVATITLDSDHTWQAATPELTVGTWEADGNAANAAGNLYGEVSPSTPAAAVTLISAGVGNQSPDPVTTVPPFRACVLCQFVGFP